MTAVRRTSWVCALVVATAGCAKEDGGGGPGATDSGTPTTGSPTPMLMPTPSGGMIRGGVCYPPKAPTRTELGAQVEVLVKKPGDLSFPYAYATGVYYTNRGDGMYRIAPGGTTSELLVATPDETQNYSTPAIAGGYLYYGVSDAFAAGPSRLERLPLSDLGAVPELVLEDARGLIAVDATHLYVSDTATGDIYREPVGGGDSELLQSGVGAEVLHLGGDGYLYYGWTSGDPEVWRIPIAGGTPENVISVAGGNFRALMLAPGGLVWTAYMYGLFFTPFGEPTTAQRLHPDGMIDVLAVEDDRVFWLANDSFDNTVGWTKLDNSDCDALIDGGGELRWAAVGSDGIYITTFGTTDPPDHLYRIPRQ